MFRSSIIFVLGIISAQSTVTIEGNVVDKQDIQISNVVVTYYRSDGDVFETMTNDSGYFELNIPTLGIEPEPFPTTFSLSQNYPNPFNPVTHIPLSISEPSTFTIHNILGQEIQRATLSEPGEYRLKWGGLTTYGTRVGAGVYIYTLHETSGSSRSRKMILLDAGGVTGLSVSHLPAMAYIIELPPALYEENALTLFDSETPTITDSLTFSGEHVEPFGFTQFALDTFITQTLNHGPISIDSIPDISLETADSVTINLNDFFYNDDISIYTSTIGVITDSLFSYSPDTAITIIFQVTATDAYYEPLSATSNAITLTVSHANLPPYFEPIDTLYTVEDSLLQFPLNHWSHDPNGDSLTIVLNNLQNATWDFGGVNSVIIPDQDWFGIIDSLTFTASDSEFAVTSEPFVIIVAPINDAPVFSGNIEDFVGNDDLSEYGIPVNSMFSDPEGDALTYSVNLNTGYWSYEPPLMVIFLNEGDDFPGLYVTANDGEIETQSNEFNVNWPIIIIPPDTFNVHFDMRDFKTDTTLSTGISTWTIDGIEYTSTDGTLDIELIEGEHTFNATNPNTIDGMYFDGEDYLMLKRPGNTEAFEVRAGPDDESNINITSIDTIIVEKLMSDVLLYESKIYLNSEGNGTVRFGPEYLNAPAWWDLNHQPTVPYIVENILDLLENHLPQATLGKLNFQYQESLTHPTPGEPVLYMFMDGSVPGSGNNITSFDENNNITFAQASWPIGPIEYTTWIEILQAVLDLPDIGDVDPLIISSGADGLYINSLGQDIFTLGMAFPANTYFDDFWGSLTRTSPNQREYAEAEVFVTKIIPYIIEHKDELTHYILKNETKLKELGLGKELDIE